MGDVPHGRLVPENNRVRVPGWGWGRDGGISVLRRGGRLWVNICASVQILVQKIGGGQSEIFTVSRRADPIGQ